MTPRLCRNQSQADQPQENLSQLNQFKNRPRKVHKNLPRMKARRRNPMTNHCLHQSSSQNKLLRNLWPKNQSLLKQRLQFKKRVMRKNQMINHRRNPSRSLLLKLLLASRSLLPQHRKLLLNQLLGRFSLQNKWLKRAKKKNQMITPRRLKQFKSQGRSLLRNHRCRQNLRQL